MSELLKIKDLSVDIMSTRGLVHAVRNVSLTIDSGAVHGVVGESGCGKSVTARTVMQLHDRRTVRVGGEILFEGKNLLDLSEREMEKIRGRKIGMIFQDPMSALNPLYKVGDQIAEVFCRHFHDSKKTAKGKALDLLEQVGIFPAAVRYEQYPFEFSGGMLQRAVIAMAIAAKPSLIIADEPTTALDVTIQAQILELLQSLQKKLQVSVFLITHNFGIVAEMCDNISVMYAGTILETGKKEDVLLHTFNPYSKALIESIPKTGHRGEHLKTIPGVPPELFDPVPGCPFMPRCACKSPVCEKEMPRLLEREPGTGHMAACHEGRRGESLE